MREARASTGNQINFMTGIQEDAILATIASAIQTAAAGNAAGYFGIGFNSTTSFSGQSSFVSAATAAATYGANTNGISVLPTIGKNYIASLEKSDGTNSNNFDNLSLNTLTVQVRY